MEEQGKELTNTPIKGTALDTRIQHSILTDATLQADLTADEFRAFINLMVWVVSQVSDGVFNPDRSRIVTNVSGENLARFVELGLVDRRSADEFCIVPAYWGWQSSRADLERQAENRRKATERKRVEREKQAVAVDHRPPPEWVSPQADKHVGQSLAETEGSTWGTLRSTKLMSDRERAAFAMSKIRLVDETDEEYESRQWK